MNHVPSLVCGFALDALLGDPYRMPHVIRLVGKLIEASEHGLRRAFPSTPSGERAAGKALVLLVGGLSCAGSAGLVRLASNLHPAAGFAARTILCYQLVAAKQLRVEALKVRDALARDGVEAAREAVSMIVGRDTQNLDEAGVVRAAVETVAENASDGVVAPLLFMAVGGAPAGMLYKAVNTMDSMVGYKNERYLHFGRTAAKTDDILNWIPARVTGVLMCAVAPLAGLSGKGAWRIFLRDRRKHASPNAAHPEAACAGALGVQLAGPTSYFGVMHNKPTIGDDLRPIEVADIDRATRLLACTSVTALVLAVGMASALQKASPLWAIIKRIVGRT